MADDPIASPVPSPGSATAEAAATHPVDDPARGVLTPDGDATTDVTADATDAATDATDATAGVGDRTASVTRSTQLDAEPADVWRVVADPAERGLWLDDPDATERVVRIDEQVADRRLVWTWWHPDDEGGASTVSVVLAPLDGGGTRVDVTESRPAPIPVGARLRSSASSAAVVGRAGITAAGRAPSWVRCAGDRWDGRLLGLELAFVAARVLTG